MELETTTYIRAVSSALGYAVPDYKIDAIDSFIVKEKSAGRWTLHKFLWMPVWGNSTANRICMKNGVGVGTYPNGMINNMDNIKGDGIYKYFDTTVNPYIFTTYPNIHAFTLLLNTPTTGALYGVGQELPLLEITQNTGFIYTLSGYSADGKILPHIDNTGFIYTLSGYCGVGNVVSPTQNTGFLYTLSGSIISPVEYLMSDNTGVFWNLSGGLT